MEIKQDGWVFEVRNNVKNWSELTLTSEYFRCGTCDAKLENWYKDILTNLKNFLPHCFRPICCGCATRQALNLNYCPVCHGTTSVMWDSGSVLVYCLKHSCGWREFFPKEDVEKDVKKHLLNLWQRWK